MQKPRQRVTKRNNRPVQKSIARRKRLGTRKPGLAIPVALAVACFLLAIGLWLAICYLQKGNPVTSLPAVGVQELVRRGAKRVDLDKFRPKQFQRVQDQEAQEGGIELPEDGVIHIPDLLPLSKNNDAYRSPLLIFTCRRQQYLSQTLDDILVNIGEQCAFGCPVIVSEDGSHEAIRLVLETYAAKFQLKGVPLIHMQHHQASLPDQMLRRRNPSFGYQALAQHYGWGLSKVFGGLDPSLPTVDRVIILEEDIHTSPDFFSFMRATSKLLDEDPNLLAVSAYNDNGHMAKDPYRILRSDFFPGLGWMMNRRLWLEELEEKWPKGYWDDWLREPDQRKGRHVLRPEVSRTYHFGSKGGTSQNEFGSILSKVKLNRENIDWMEQDLSYLREDAFDEMYGKRIAGSTLVETVSEVWNSLETQDTRIEYGGLSQFQAIANKIGIMDDEKAQVPRTAYKGVVEIRPSGDYILFLTPHWDELKILLPSVENNL